jgi:hypothetical protein
MPLLAPNWQQCYAGPELKCTVDKLKADSLYALRVRVKDDRGFSQWSDEIQLKTSALDRTLLGDSTILTDAKHQATLHQYYGSTVAWKAAWRGSRDGFTGKKFHQLCDKKGEVRACPSACLGKQTMHVLFLRR